MGARVKRNIERLISVKGWTLYRLSKKSGVSLTALYSLDHKKNGPTAEVLVRLADTLGATVDELVR